LLDIETLLELIAVRKGLARPVLRAAAAQAANGMKSIYARSSPPQNMAETLGQIRVRRKPAPECHLLP
jgi:hypothetical protein